MADQPGYTRVPNELLELLPRLPNAEMRVMLVVIRKTTGWQKVCDVISFSQIKAATDMSQQGVINGIEGAIKRGILAREASGHNNGFCYQIPADINYAQVVNELDHLRKQSTKKTSQRTRLLVVNEVDHLSPQVVNEVDTQKKDSKEKKERVSANASAPRTPRKKSEKQPPKETTPIGIIKALATACQIDRDLATKETHIILAEAAGRLYKAGKGKEQTDEQIAETIRYVGSYFMKNDWRGKKGEPPTPGQLLDIWKRAIDARQTAAPETKYYQSQAHKYLQGDELRAAFDEAARKRARIRSVGEA